jgi:hypothetical protein
MNKDRLCALLVFASAFATYASSASGFPASWDYAEQQTVPYILGIAHPTGFPLFTLAGWLFTHVVPLGSVAWRMNVFSGFCVAVASAGVALIAVRLGAGRVEAFLGALIFAWCELAWAKGTHADPHATSLALVVLALLFARRYAKGGAARDLVAACLSAGLGLATHPETIFCLPAIGVALLIRGRPDRRTVLWALAALALPLTLYAYLPLRSAYVAAHGLDPTAAAPVLAAGTSAWDTDHPRSLAGFLAEISGSQFGASGALLALFDVRGYAPAAALWSKHLQTQLPVLAIVLGTLGALGVLLRDARSAAVLAAGTLGAIPFVYAYRGVEGDIDRYFLPSFALIALLAATSARLSIEGFAPALRRIAVIVLLAIALASQWAANRGALDGRLDKGYQGSIDAVRRDIPDGAIVVAGWVLGTTLEYGAYVDRSLGSRIIVVGWPSDFKKSYARWSAAKPVYIFADDDTLPNAREVIPKAWITNRLSSDGHDHVLRIEPPRR